MSKYNYSHYSTDDNRWTDEEIIQQYHEYLPIMKRIIRIYGTTMIPDFSYKGAIEDGLRVNDEENILICIRRGQCKKLPTIKAAVKFALLSAANRDWYYTNEKEY